MVIESMHDLLVSELKDLYSAEHQLIKALPHMAKGAHNPALRAAFEGHLQQTQRHAERLDQICAGLEITPRGKKCAAMEGLIAEAKELLEVKGDDLVRDAGLIGAAQKVEHYEIAGYGTARAHAQQLGYSVAMGLLQQTLDEEAAANQKLTEIAENSVNQEAAMQHDNGRFQGAAA